MWFFLILLGFIAGAGYEFVVSRRKTRRKLQEFVARMNREHPGSAPAGGER